MIVVQRHSCQRCHSPCPSICLTLSVVSIAAKSVERITYDSWVLKNSQERKKSRPSGFGDHPLLFLCVFFFGFLCHFSVQRAEGSFFFQWNAQVSTERRDDDKETMTVMTVPILDLAKRRRNQSGMKLLYCQLKTPTKTAGILPASFQTSSSLTATKDRPDNSFKYF